MTQTAHQRRVALLETDERSGLVASIAQTCAHAGVSLEITTGPGHVLLTFTADNTLLDQVRQALAAIPGVQAAHVYCVLPSHTL